MKFSLKRKEFVQTLQDLKKIVPSKPQLPILQAVLIEADKKGSVLFSATDLYTGIQSKIVAIVEDQGKTAVPIAPLYESLVSFPEETVHIEVKEGKISLTGKKAQISIQCFDAEEYPSFPEKEGNTIKLDQDLLKQVVKYVLIATAKDDSRPVLTSVLFSFQDSGLKIVATDGFRLSLLSKKISKKSGNLLIPAKALQEIARLSDKTESQQVSLTVSTELKQMFCGFGDTEMVIRLMEGEFPPYQKIIPQEFLIKVLVDSESLVQMIKGAMVFARDTSNIITFEFLQEEMNVTAASPTLGKHQSSLKIQRIEGQKTIKIAFNAQYVLEFLQSSKTKTVVIAMNESLQPAVFYPEEMENFKYIVMPFRVNQAE